MWSKWLHVQLVFCEIHLHMILIGVTTCVWTISVQYSFGYRLWQDYLSMSFILCNTLQVHVIPTSEINLMIMQGYLVQHIKSCVCVC